LPVGLLRLLQARLSAAITALGRFPTRLQLKEENVPSFNHEKLRHIAAALLAGAGCSQEEAAIVAENLVEANLKGHDSHGIVNLPSYIAWLATGGVRPNQPITVVREDQAFIVIDANRGLGQSVTRKGMELAIGKALLSGVAILAIRRSGHMGRIGAYGEQCARAGLVSLHFANVVGHPPNVAPFAAREARFATNPFCFTVPGSMRNAAIVLDCATSKVAWGKLKVALNKGEMAPEGLLLDTAGHPSRDPSLVVPDPVGAMVVFGEHKGSGIALICELLGGALTGGDTIQPGNTRDGVTINNMLSILIDPRRMTTPERIDREFDAVIEYVRSAMPLKSSQPVQVPGEPEHRAMTDRLRNGIQVDDRTWHELQQLARTMSVDLDTGS
jgi:hydroxycarboxylate dehydrogenase B